MLRITVLVLLSIALLACNSPAEDVSNSRSTGNRSIAQPEPRPEIVTATANETQLKMGGKGEAEVRLKIADGYHVNANPPSEKFYIGTELKVQPLEGIEPGKPIYPAGINKKFGFSSKELAVYEGEPTIKLPLSATSAATSGKHSLPAKIYVQPCNDEACFPPRHVQLNIPVSIN